MSNHASPTPDPASRRQLRQLFSRHGFRPRRRLGQTFLVDRNIVRNIVAAAELTGAEPVLEIGAGAGVVTIELARAARRVLAIEIDPRLVAILRETVGDSAEIVQADILTVAWRSLLGPANRGAWRVVANLPYAITGPALLRLTEAREWVERLTIMVQHEVAGRLLAPPGGRARGMLSVVLQALFDIELVAHVSRTCFWPRPRVDSTLLALNVRRPPLISASIAPAFRRAARAAFATRRKTLINALAHAPELELSKEQAGGLLSECGIDPIRRAETLTQEEFLLLAKAIARRQRAALQ